MPKAATADFTSGDPTGSLTAVLSSATISAGVPAGAARPFQLVTS